MENQDVTTAKETPLLVFKGFMMGSADIIPGVSGGTMALILGIYQRLLNAIKSFNKNVVHHLFIFKFKEAFSEVHWRFLLALAGGMVGAVLFFTKIVPLQVYMHTDPELIYGLFFGLILGSIYILYKATKSKKWTNILFLLAGIIVGFWIVTLVPANTSDSPWFVFITGSVAITAMIMPGISGSYILLILRKYDYILSNIGQLGSNTSMEALIVLIPFGLGALTGLVLFSRILSWLLDRFHTPTLMVLIGFLIGSLYVIWPYQERTYTEFEKVERLISVDSELAQKLSKRKTVPQKPEYHTLGDTVTSEGKEMVEYVKVKRKMIASSPFIPYSFGENKNAIDFRHFWSGIIGMLTGILLVGGLERIR